MKKYGYVETDGMFTEEGNKQAARVIHGYSEDTPLYI